MDEPLQVNTPSMSPVVDQRKKIDSSRLENWGFGSMRDTNSGFRNTCTTRVPEKIETNEMTKFQTAGTRITGTTTVGVSTHTDRRTVRQRDRRQLAYPIVTVPTTTLGLNRLDASTGRSHQKTEGVRRDVSSIIKSPESSSPFPKLLRESRISERWKCQYQIGSGSFGEIYLGINVNDGSKVAIKVEPVKTKYPQLLHEAKILRQMQGYPGFPRLHYSGVHAERFNVVVMELLGPTLEEIFSRWGGKHFTLFTIAMIGIQMIERLEALHLQGFIHRDVKPDNFLIGVAKDLSKVSLIKICSCIYTSNAPLLNLDQVYCIDFGLAKRYRDTVTHTHIPYSDRKNLTGTARYASINAHRGIEPSRRDDLISAGYALLYFAKGGELPWQGLQAANKEEKYSRIMEKKRKTSIEELTKGLPEAFRQLLKHSSELKFDQQPDYQFLKNLLRYVAIQYKPAVTISRNLPVIGVESTSRNKDTPCTRNRRLVTLFEKSLQPCVSTPKGFSASEMPIKHENKSIKFITNDNASCAPVGEDPSLSTRGKLVDNRVRKGKGAFCLSCLKALSSPKHGFVEQRFPLSHSQSQVKVS